MVRWLPLLIVPLLVALFASALLHLISPIYAGLVPYDYDPAYIYLFNGLGIVEGYGPRHTDHPGTPLQLLIGLIVYVAHAAMRVTGMAANDIGASVTAAPETYLATASAVTLALNVLAIFYLGLRVLRATARIELALAAQASLLLLGALMPRVTYISAEALVIFATVMTAACEVCARCAFVQSLGGQADGPRQPEEEPRFSQRGDRNGPDRPVCRSR